MNNNAPVVTLRWFLALAAIIMGWRLLAALTLPVTTDEAYYFQWALQPDWGYFDHPPGVLATAWFYRFADHASWFWGRFGSWLVAGGQWFLMWRLYRLLGLGSLTTWLALLLSAANAMGLIFGFVTTPDVLLLFAWTWALYECLLALRGHRRRWLLAGVATGLGLLAKYTMLLIGPVFLWAMIRADRKALATPWPYLGGVVALVVFLPHLSWNHHNDWITFRFQVRHGFEMARPNPTANILPRPLEPLPDSVESRLAAQFGDLEQAEKREEKRPRWYDGILKSLNRYVGFYGSQIGFWAFLLIPLGARLRAAWRREERPPEREMDHAGHTVMMAGTWVPLIVFGLLALASKVEANWSAMYVIGAAPLLAAWVTKRWRQCCIAALANLLIVASVLAHTQLPWMPVRPDRDRVAKETSGYFELSKIIASKQSPVFADSYQISSMLRHYLGNLKITQWPGITRDSELTRRVSFNTTSFQTLREAGDFWLVTTNRRPPRIPEFVPVELSQLRYCRGSGLQKLEGTPELDVASRCKQPIHKWYLVHYVAQDRQP